MRHRLVVGFTAAAAIGMAAWCLLPDTVIAHNTDLDEGVYLMVARLLHRGYKTDTFFFDQFWLFPKIITAAFAFFGDSLIVARLTIFGFSLAGLLGVAALSYQLGAGWMAATAAIFIGAIDPLYIRGSRMTLADVPAATCIIWALALVFLFEKNRRRIWIGLGGFCAGVALVMKPFALGFVASIIIVLLNQRTRRENGRLKFDPAIGGDLLVFALAAIFIAAPFINVFHPVQEYQRVLGFHLAERDWMIKRVDDRWHGLLVFARLNLPILLFAISGLISLRPLPISIMALLIGELVTAGILLDMPPWIHHYILILPLLVVFCVLGFGPGLRRFRHLISDFRDGRRPTFENKWGPIFFAVAILVSVIDLPWLIKYDHRERFPESLRVEPVVRYVEQTFGPNDYLMSDDALVPYLADRLIPPSAINFVFGDVMKFDRPTLPRFEQIVRDNHIAGIITTTRYPRNPQLMSWIEENFPISREIGTHHPDELTARIYSTDKQQR
ncbi:MAG TPA: hypothetical protein VMO75_00340 [Chthoniobacterales bacterium]|nr:hypothetical protein [Chthoniobacterales bacterium]